MVRFALALLIIVLAPVPTLAVPITSPQQLGPNPTIIDFENFDTDGRLVTTIPNPLTISGVTFTSVTGTLSIFDITVAGWAADGTEVAHRTLFPGAEPDSAISIVFESPVAEVLVGWGDPDFVGNVLRAYGRDGDLLEEAAVELGVDAAWIGFSRPTPDIYAIVVQPDQSLPSGDDYVIDNIHYRTAPKPVAAPPAWVLLAVGLAALSAVNRIRRHGSSDRSHGG